MLFSWKVKGGWFYQFKVVCLTLCHPMDCGLQGFSVHGILQTRILEWIAMPFSRDLPDPGVEPGSPALQADSTIWTTREALINSNRQAPDLKIQSAGNRKNHHHKWKITARGNLIILFQVLFSYSFVCLCFFFLFSTCDCLPGGSRYQGFNQEKITEKLSIEEALSMTSLFL